MKLKPFKEIIAMTKEGLDAALAPMRSRKMSRGPVGPVFKVK